MLIKQVVEGYEFKDGQLLFTPPRVILSSASPRRAEFINEVFGRKTVVENFGEFGDEPAYDVVSVASFKAERLLEHLRNTKKLNKYRDSLVVAADTRTSIPHRDGQLDCKGKPKTIEEVQVNFRNMIDFATKQNDNPFYMVSSGAVAKLVRVPTPLSETLEEVTISLDYGGVSYLATDEGTERYLRALEVFYNKEPYVSKSMHGLTFRDLSGGLSLPVLMRLRLVKMINQVGINDVNFVNTFRNAIHIVAIGMPPRLFRPYNTQVENKYNSWDWLNKVTEIALEVEELYD